MRTAANAKASSDWNTSSKSVTVTLSPFSHANWNAVATACKHPVKLIELKQTFVKGASGGAPLDNHLRHGASHTVVHAAIMVKWQWVKAPMSQRNKVIDL